uniref:Uncharacterized protein n=1 Tax=Heterorhabditis bacteriophora TaxID=37862 RepID=A0A1I7WAG3_HETBA
MYFYGLSSDVEYISHIIAEFDLKRQIQVPARLQTIIWIIIAAIFSSFSIHLVSLVQYNSEPYLEFSLRKHNCKKFLLDDIADTEYMQFSVFSTFKLSIFYTRSQQDYVDQQLLPPTSYRRR